MRDLRQGKVRIARRDLYLDLVRVEGVRVKAQLTISSDNLVRCRSGPHVPHPPEVIREQRVRYRRWVLREQPASDACLLAYSVIQDCSSEPQGPELKAS